MATFRDLQIGQTFDFVSPNRCLNSFFDRCQKITGNSYKSTISGLRYTVGKLGVDVYHVGHEAMTRAEIASALDVAVTRFDRLQSKKKSYNVYALGQYLLRASQVIERLDAGQDLEGALRCSFNDRLLDFLLRWFGINSQA